MVSLRRPVADQRSGISSNSEADIALRLRNMSVESSRYVKAFVVRILPSS